jgi:predicted N-acetyltransferase YhbS
VPIVIERICKKHIPKCRHFGCGHDKLNNNLKNFGYKNDRDDVNRTYVAIDTDQDKVVGYYSIVASAIASDKIPSETKRPYPFLGAVLIGNLAVDDPHKKGGIGKRLVSHAFSIAADVSAQVGVQVVIVDSLIEAVGYYKQKFGFQELKSIADDKQVPMFLPMSAVRAAVTKLTPPPQPTAQPPAQSPPAPSTQNSD